MENDFLKEFEYCIIGPKYVLRSFRNPKKTESSDSRFPFVLRVDSNTSKGIAHLESDIIDGGIVLMKLYVRNPLTLEDQGEIYRLFSRVCLRLSNAKLPTALKVDLRTEPKLKAILENDGFSSKDDVFWIRPPNQYVLEKNKASNMEEVYNDPFFIPWNFVPLEFDAYEPLLNIKPDKRREKRLLDLGCGFGKNSLFLESQEFNVFGLDISQTAISRCRSLVKNPSHFVRGSVTNLPWEAKIFDYIIDVGCLHCLPNDEREFAIKEISRSLKQTGIIYSRIFKPRDLKWLLAQPFETSQFGMTEDEVLNLFSKDFNFQFWKQNKDIHYICCTKK